MTMTSLQTRIADLENRIFGWKADYAFHRFMLALKAGFNREQPRDEWGRWMTGGGALSQRRPDFIRAFKASMRHQTL
jgi:hypothetical protein